jgi:galactonate dehydratase
MKVARVATYAVDSGHSGWLFVKVESDDATLHGWGEASLPFKIKSVRAEVEGLADVIIGEDAFRTEHLWQLMYRQHSRGGLVTSSAIAGIDQALWDLKARALGVPLYELLGGRVRDRVRVYDHLETPLRKYDWDSPEGFAEAAGRSLADGFDAVKVYPVPATRALEGREALRWAESVLAAVRDAVGDDADVIVDLHGRTSPVTAIQYARAFEPYHPLFLEEPCQPEGVEALAKVARSTRTPIALGERLATRWDFARVLEARACAVVQPDLSYCGGISEFRRIADLAQLHFATIAPHNSAGPIATLHNIQAACTLPSFLLLEQVRLDVPWRDEIVTSPPDIRGGFAHPSDRPGIGADVREDICRAHPYEHHPRSRSYARDGSLLDE